MHTDTAPAPSRVPSTQSSLLWVVELAAVRGGWRRLGIDPEIRSDPKRPTVSRGRPERLSARSGYIVAVWSGASSYSVSRTPLSAWSSIE